MPKLTLSVDEEVIARAKQYAKQRGVSISSMVEAYLASVAGPSSNIPRETPVLRSLRGTIKNADLNDYRKHLADKYQ